MNILVTITGDRQEIAAFKSLGDKLTDFSDAMDDLGKELKTYYSKEVMGSGGGKSGGKWPALSPAYKRRKRKTAPGKGLLVASGKMQSSFRAVSDKSSVVIDNTRTVGTKRKYNLLSIHHNGLGRVPVRPVLVVNRDVKEITQHIIEDDVRAKLKAATR